MGNFMKPDPHHFSDTKATAVVFTFENPNTLVLSQEKKASGFSGWLINFMAAVLFR